MAGGGPTLPQTLLPPCQGWLLLNHCRAGALSRMLERGARSIATIFRAIVFTFLPTTLELAGAGCGGLPGGEDAARR